MPEIPPNNPPTGWHPDPNGTDTPAPPDASNPPKRKRGALRKIVVLVAAVVALLVVLYSVTVTFVAQSYLIPSEAMAPTLNVGDHIIVNKIKYRFSPAAAR